MYVLKNYTKRICDENCVTFGFRSGHPDIQDQMRRSIDNISAWLRFLKCIAERIYPRDPGQPNLRI